MRILTFSSLFPNAVNPAHGIFVYRRASNLASVAGEDVEVIAPVPFVPKKFKWQRWNVFSGVPAAEQIGALWVHHPRYPLLPKVSMQVHGLLMYLGVKRLALRLHRARPFDCIDAHYLYPDGFAAVLLGQLLRIPVVVWALGTDINLFPSFPTIRPLIRWTLRKSSGLVAVSSSLKQRMIELGAPAEKIQFIGNGVDAELFQMGDRRSARRALGIPENGRILVSVAALRQAKGQQHVVSALAQLVSAHPELKLYLVGEGDYRKHLEDLIKKLALQDRVFLVGSRSNTEIPLWFNAADASILASSREGWPNVVLESLACGTPVIGTRAGQIPEILASSDLGIVTEQDSNALASAIDTALGRTWDREALSRFAFRRPWSKVALEIQDYLAKITGNRNSGCAVVNPS